MTSDKTFEDILSSVKGLEKAQPKKELYNEIEKNLFNQKVSLVPINRLKWVAAAAIFFFCVNTGVLFFVTHNESMNNENSTRYKLITNFNYYE